MTREVSVLLFARLREVAGSDRLSLAIPIAVNVAELRRCVARQIPQAAELISRCAVAVNGDYANDESTVPEGAEVALIPPVSGGQC